MKSIYDRPAVVKTITSKDGDISNSKTSGSN